MNAPARPPRAPSFAPAVPLPRPRTATVSVLLWFATVVAEAAGALLDFTQLRGDLVTEVMLRFPDESATTRERVVVAALAILIGSGVLTALLQIGFATALKGGRKWARVALVPIGLGGAVAFGVVSQPALAGLVPATGAAVAMFLPASSTWLAGRRS
ncbi:MAG: hypothetical protein ABIQ18_45970 [Umezawaea sp.]